MDTKLTLESQEIVIIKDTPIEERILEFKNQPKRLVYGSLMSPRPFPVRT